MGEQCVDLQCYFWTTNITLNFLAGVDGLNYANIVQGAPNSIEFWRFFSEVSQTVDPNTLRSVLEVEEILVVDNFTAHHGDAKVALWSFLNDVEMELLYLPAYSPDLNANKEVFSKLKYLNPLTPDWNCPRPTPCSLVIFEHSRASASTKNNLYAQ